MTIRKTVYDYLDYREYLRDFIGGKPSGGRGFRALAARELGCQPSYVSQVLREKMHLSLEQSVAMNRLLGHSQDESEFFLVLVQFSRVGTPEARDYFRARIQRSLHDRVVENRKLRNESNLTFEQQTRYYSAWYYSAIRVALGVPGLRTVRALARHFGIPEPLVAEALSFMQDCDMIVEKDGYFSGKPHHFVLAGNSPLLSRSHTNWRVKAITSLQQEGPRDFHFSSAVTLSREDAYKLQALFVKYVEECQNRIAHSSDETVAAICLDFFEL